MANTANTAARKPAARKAANRKPAAVIVSDNATATPPAATGNAIVLAGAALPAHIDNTPGKGVITIDNATGAVTETAALPAAHNSAGWLAMFENLPAWSEMLAEMRAHKYGKGKGLVPCAATMFGLTRIGTAAAATGLGKNGKPNVQAATCRALALAMRATGENKVCGAAVVYYMLTDSNVLSLLRESKATKYVGKTGTPAPAWCSGYVVGNAAAVGFFTKG